MSAVVTFQRIYPHGAGLKHEATPGFVTAVLRSMQEAATSESPFSVLLRMDDGSSVTVKPKRRAA